MTAVFGLLEVSDDETSALRHGGGHVRSIDECSGRGSESTRIQHACPDRPEGAGWNDAAASRNVRMAVTGTIELRANEIDVSPDGREMVLRNNVTVRIPSDPRLASPPR